VVERPPVPEVLNGPLRAHERGEVATTAAPGQDGEAGGHDGHRLGARMARATRSVEHPRPAVDAGQDRVRQQVGQAEYPTIAR
jgi:hypothetical protein